MVAVVHAFISQFAIGGGLFLVLAEKKAYRENDERMIPFLKDCSLFFVLITLVLGAMTGVGIWFTIGLITPSATSSLIHAFVFGWAIEWVFFLVEISAAFFYFYGWNRMSRKVHLRIGWIYFVAAWLSLFVINGILAFMLNPGQWIQSRSFADGFFNPLFWPSLFIRTLIAMALAGVYALLASSRLKDLDLREKMVKYSSKWLLPSILLLPVGLVWALAMVPPGAQALVLGGAPAVVAIFSFALLFAGLVFIFTLLGPYLRPRDVSWPFALAIFILAFLAIGTSEWVREAIRKPYIIYGYLYSNSIPVDQEDEINQAGILKMAKWARVEEVKPGEELEAGREIFRVECQSCHAIDGYNGIRPLVKGWTEQYADYQLNHLHELKRFMPPFMGSEAERQALKKWLLSIS